MSRLRHAAENGFAPGFVACILQHALGGPGKTPVYGIVGLQGSGKSTLAAQMASLGKRHGLKIAVVSIDDFYLGKRDRRALARDVHPLLARRGPPGTHDVALACQVLARLKQGKPVRLPRFDKLADTRLPPSRWPSVAGRADLVILEGWCLFASAEPQSRLLAPINRLEREQDPEGVWRNYCNTALEAYAEIWKCIDRSLFLQGPGFEHVRRWRWQQEQSLQAKHPGRRTMSKADVENFVLLFERTSRNVIARLPKRVDRVVRLDENRIPETQGRSKNRPRAS